MSCYQTNFLGLPETSTNEEKLLFSFSYFIYNIFFFFILFYFIIFFLILKSFLLCIFEISP